MFLIFSDIHMKEWRPFSTVLSNGLNSRLMEQIKVLQQVKQIARKYKVSNIFFLGDLFDSQASTISKIVINTAFFMIQSLAELCSMYILVGNHDQFGPINTLTPFSSIPNVKIIDKTTTIKLDNRTIDLIPYNGLLPVKKSNFCFGHFGIKGATVGNGFTIQEEGIEPQLLKEYQLVLAGHWHTRQQVADNAYQIGSVMNINFSNTIEDKGVFLLEPSTNELQFIPIKSPKFITYEIATNKDLEEIKIEPDNYYKLIIKNDALYIQDQPNMMVEYQVDPKPDEKELIDTSDITNLKPLIQEFIINSNTSLPKDILIRKAIELLEM